jgi:hypothetical protein
MWPSFLRRVQPSPAQESSPKSRRDAVRDRLGRSPVGVAQSGFTRSRSPGYDISHCTTSLIEYGLLIPIIRCILLRSPTTEHITIPSHTRTYTQHPPPTFGATAPWEPAILLPPQTAALTFCVLSSRGHARLGTRHLLPYGRPSATTFGCAISTWKGDV